MTPALSITRLTKRFRDTVAVDGVSFDVQEGSIFGFLGPNGAGKTTTLRIVTGLASATSGRVRVFDHDPGTPSACADIGYLPDVPGFYEWMNAREFMRFAGSLFGLPSRTISTRTDSLLEMAGLAGVDTRIGGYSRGMRQRLGIAQALINAPRLLLLDEPTSALDPLGRKDVLDMIASLSGRTTVLFSTHILADVERVCDTVAIIDAGRVIEQASVDSLRARHGSHTFTFDVVGPSEPLVDALGRASWVTEVHAESPDRVVALVTSMDVATREVVSLIAAAGVPLRGFASGQSTLEEAFMHVIGSRAPSTPSRGGGAL